MSGPGTKNYNLQYLDPSQSQPEVKINADLDEIDQLIFEAGGALTVKQVGDSPGGNAVNVRTLHIAGATVEQLTDGGCLVTISASSESGGSDSGGGSIEVTDGVHTVSPCTQLRFTNGAVSDAGGGVAHYTAPSGGGGGGSDGSSLANFDPSTHPSSPMAPDDEFEGTAGSGIDPKWGWQNQGSATATITGDGSIYFVEPNSGGGADFKGFLQAAPSAPWKIRGKIASNCKISGANNAYIGVCVFNSGNGTFYVLGPMNEGGGIGAHPVLLFTGGFAASSGSVKYGNTGDGAFYGMQSQFTFYEIENDATSLYFRISATGVNGSFVQVYTVALATAIAAVDNFGFAFNGGYLTQGLADFFRQVA